MQWFHATSALESRFVAAQRSLGQATLWTYIVVLSQKTLPSLKSEVRQKEENTRIEIDKLGAGVPTLHGEKMTYLLKVQ